VKASLGDMVERIKIFRDERDWMQFHNHKDMAISIVIEAAELLEHFQWQTEEEIEEHVIQNKANIGEEIADIAIYLIELADNLGINLVEAMDKKLDKNALKYPVEKARGRHDKYTEL
jgi:dCTP diphosphatase